MTPHVIPPGLGVDDDVKLIEGDDVLADAALWEEEFLRSHRFGGPWTLIKLEAISKYLSAFTTALKHQPFRLLYIDAFAGNGECDVGDMPLEEVHPGSAQIATKVTPPFHELIFIERNARRCAQLASVTPGNGQAVRIIPGDANKELVRLCETIDWKRTRAVLFLDPYGMSVAWPTLQRIAATRAIDVWYLFPLNALCRQLARNFNAVDSPKMAAITRILGTEEWKRDLYSPPRIKDMFEEQAPQRHADAREIVDFVTKRLATIFARVEGPKLLHLRRPDQASAGTALYALYFAVSNPGVRAAQLACGIAHDVLASLD